MFQNGKTSGTTPKGNMGYDQYTVPNDCSSRTYFCCFTLALANICPWALVPFFQISLKKRELKITHNAFQDCRVHFSRQPFSKQLYMRYAKYPTEDRPVQLWSFWPCCTSKANRDFTTQTKFTEIIVVVSVGILVIFIYYFTSYTHHHLMQNAQLLYSNIFLINSPLSKTLGKSLSSSIALVPVHWHLQRNYLSKHNTAGGWQGSGFVALWSHHERFFAALDKGSQPIL